MERLLSVLLPVRDVQATLAASVHKILDAASDSGNRFELLIIDDGSTDATGEVAHELTCHYPQIRVVRHLEPLGHEAAICTGLKCSRGEMVVLGDENSGFRMVEQPHPRPGRIPSQPAVPNYIRRLKNLVLDG